MNHDSAKRGVSIFRYAVTSFLALAMVGSVAVHSLPAAEIETYAFEKVWWRTDLPVRMNRADRTWVWGPEPITSLLLEPYDQGAATGVEGARWVQYFDKTRVEITRSDSERDDRWFVTNGLLARELITGRIQLGDDRYVRYEPAEVNVAGDDDDPDGPTYLSLNLVMDESPYETGEVVSLRLDRDGSVSEFDGAADHAVLALSPVESSDHTIASVFWEFMTSEGVIYNGFDYVDGPLFDDPFFATGLPITEPYWTTVRLRGESTDVLIQAFERRVLTFTPQNRDGWKVEAANVGRHYYQWRYLNEDEEALSSSELTETRDLAGNLVLLGEVENSARASYAEVQVDVTLFDESGEAIQDVRTYLDFALIEPGERLPFQIWTEYQGEYSDYEVTIQSRPSHRFHRPDVVVDTVRGEWASRKRYDVRGTIRNGTDDPVEYLQFVIALYARDGSIVDYRWGMIEPIVLEPGDEAEFETFFFNPGRFSDYQVFITN